jgi:DNA-binding LacI/PurR family transcriptional regulator
VEGQETGSSDTGARRRQPPVMADVALLAGVSHMTVSRVLNDHPGVRAETRSRVLAAMRELDYRPNTAARALVTGRSRTLGVVRFETTLYGPTSTLFGIEQAARSAGYFVNIVSLRSINRRSIGEAVDNLRGQAVEGVIIIAPHISAAKALSFLPKDIPLVAVEGGAGPVPIVAVDQVTGASRATAHLLSLGHQTVWHVAGPTDWLEARARERGWRETLMEASRDVPQVLIGDWSARSGYEQGKKIAAHGQASAVFVGNDQMALGVLRALREGGIAVPDEMSVVGFDDVPEAAYFCPPLTTVRQNFEQVGRRSLEVLLRQVEGTGADDLDVIVEPELVVRQSSAPLR